MANLGCGSHATFSEPVLAEDSPRSGAYVGGLQNSGRATGLCVVNRAERCISFDKLMEMAILHLNG
jgi:hypothetical protein